ncbi:MAG TPA: S46 family peptidase [Candidatus Limnocylindrales bacterium]|nr:S46 family peptidase [Candidatus Limnocylindrales bacterium]
MKSVNFVRQASTALLAATLLCPAIRADEGMWTFDNPPTKLLQEKYNFTPTHQWLDHLRLSCVRLNDGGSGSFVSPHGLLLTNHHVARGQLQKNSSAEHDYVRDGFYAATPEEEMKSPDLEVNVLVSTENVTDRVNAAVKTAKSTEEEFAKRKAVIADIERESTEKTGFRSDVVTLYAGGEYWLYRYKKYTDVRLVFAVEQQAAFFGGDPDNFTYPRYDLDMALFRVYENGKPIDSKDYLKWNPKGAGDGELVFVSGHPGSTQRLSTYADLVSLRDTDTPYIILNLKRRIAVLKEYSARGPEQSRQAASMIFGLENARKVYEGRRDGLADKNLMEKKRSEDEAFRAKVMANPDWQEAYGGAWTMEEEAIQKMKPRIKQQFFRASDSQLASLAVQIVTYVAEIKKPDGERLAGFHDSQLDSLKHRLFSPAPIYPEMEIARMTSALEAAQKELGADDAWVKAFLDARAPKDAATQLVSGTKLADSTVRKTLVEGGQGAVQASTDPMIVMARRLDPIRREQIKWFEDNVQSVEERAGELLGKARFAVYGKSTYPDATFTLRLSYGQVQGFPMNGTIAPYKTTFYGLYDRAASFDYRVPFDLPKRYVEGKDKLDLTTPFNFVTTNDIIGGNSGSPVVNRNGEVVGLIFDGNIESLVADFIYDSYQNRAVAVHTGAMTEALRKLYGAQKLMDELLGK